VRRISWPAVAAAGLVVVAACSGDDVRHAAGPPLEPSVTTTPAGSTPLVSTPPGTGSDACTLLTQEDAVNVFGTPARPAPPEDAGGDSVCAWQAGDALEGRTQALELRIHPGGSLQTKTTSTGGLLMEFTGSVDDASYSLRYSATGPIADLAGKQQAVSALANDIGRQIG
jgi:Protein of unknown function (DUF3558)